MKWQADCCSRGQKKKGEVGEKKREGNIVKGKQKNMLNSKNPTANDGGVTKN